MSSKNHRYFENDQNKSPKDFISSPAKDITLIKKRQKEIVEVACKLFFEKGYHGVSIREIGVQSGMSMGKLYHYISSKGDILFLMAKHLQELWDSHLFESGIKETSDSLVKLVKALRSSIEFPAKNKKLLQFMYSESKYFGKDHLKIILEDEEKNVVGFFRKFLEEVAKEYPIEADLDLAARFMGYITIFIAQKGYSLKKYSIEEVSDFMIDFILKGLGLPNKDIKE